MAIKVFLDSNVILEALLSRSNFAIANDVLVGIEKGSFKGYMSTSALQNCIYFLQKTYTAEQVSSLLISLLHTVQIIDANHQVVIKAVSTKAADLEDAILYTTAVYHQMDYLITFDKTFGEGFATILPIISPAELLKKFPTL